MAAQKSDVNWENNMAQCSQHGQLQTTQTEKVDCGLDELGKDRTSSMCDGSHQGHEGLEIQPVVRFNKFDESSLQTGSPNESGLSENTQQQKRRRRPLNTVSRISKSSQQAFPERQSLTTHQTEYKTEPGHSGEEALNCEVCMKTFLTRPSLRRHERIHRGSKSCKDFVSGEVRYKRKSKRIRKNSEGLFMCKNCDKGFSNKRKLKKHKIRHRSKRSRKKLARRKRKQNALQT